MTDVLNQHYAALFGLGSEWKVSRVALDILRNKVDIHLEYTAETAICPECGEIARVYDQQPERVWRHLDTMQFETLIHAKTPRVQCSRHKVRDIELPWATKSSRFTLMFEAFAIVVLQGARSIKDAQRILRLSWWQTHEIMKAAVERGLARREAEEISFVGMDEKSFLRGKGADAFACVMTDVYNHRVLEVSRGRSSEGAKALIDKALNPFQQYMVCGVAKTLKRHLYGLLSWFDSRIDNALTEGFNTTIQTLKASARGYRNFENFRIAILFYCGKLDMSPDLVRVGALNR